MGEKRKIKDIYKKLLETVNDPEIITQYDNWVILNSGNVKLIDKEHGYEIPVRLAPADWHHEGGRWSKLLENQKKKSIIYGKVKLDEFLTLIPGTIISNQGEFKGIEGIRMVVPIEFPQKLENFLTLGDIIPDEILTTLAYNFGSKTLPCYRIIGERDGKRITYILPKSELVRYYFFVGSEIVKSVAKNEHLKEFTRPAEIVVNEDTGEKIAIVEIYQGFTIPEQKVFGKMAISDKVVESVDYIYTNLLVQQSQAQIKNNFKPPTFLTTKLFQTEPIKFGTTGYFLGPPNNTFFFINQIHQVEEPQLFDKLISLPKNGDHRPLNDKELRAALRSETSKVIGLKRLAGKNPQLKRDDKADPSSEATTLQNEIINYTDFFQVKEIEVVTPEKVFQDKAYEAEGRFKIISTDNFTTDQKGIKGSTSLRARLENVLLEKKELENINISSLIQNFLNGLQSVDNFNVSFYYNTNDIAAFKKEINIIRRVYPAVNIVIMKVAINSRLFYVVDLYYGIQNLKRTQLLYRNNFGEIAPTSLENLIYLLKDHGYSWHLTFEAFNSIEIIHQGFNHKGGTGDISPYDLGVNIKNYILRVIKKDENKL